MSSIKKEIICLGNLYIKGDDICLKYAVSKEKNSFSNLSFLPCYNLDEFIDYFESHKNIIILDAIKNISSIQIFKGIDNLRNNQKYSLHDFDISSYLKIQENLGIKKNILIIGVPENITFEELDNFFLSFRE